MREITEKQIQLIIEKYREIFLIELEDSLCLEHYNRINKQNLTENDVVLKKTKCFFCGVEKLCVQNSHMD